MYTPASTTPALPAQQHSRRFMSLISNSPLVSAPGMVETPRLQAINTQFPASIGESHFRCQPASREPSSGAHRSAEEVSRSKRTRGIKTDPNPFFESDCPDYQMRGEYKMKHASLRLVVETYWRRLVSAWNPLRGDSCRRAGVVMVAGLFDGDLIVRPEPRQIGCREARKWLGHESGIVASAAWRQPAQARLRSFLVVFAAPRLYDDFCVAPES